MIAGQTQALQIGLSKWQKFVPSNNKIQLIPEISDCNLKAKLLNHVVI